MQIQVLWFSAQATGLEGAPSLACSLSGLLRRAGAGLHPNRGSGAD